MSPISLNLPTDLVQTIIPDPPANLRRPFLTPLEGLPGEFLLVLDNTALTNIKRCHKNGENYLILGREPHARNAALTFGGAIHEGLEKFHLGQYEVQYGLPSDCSAQEFMSMNKVTEDEAILRYFSENPSPPDEYRTPQIALEVLRHYRQRSNPVLHPDYEWEILADASGPIIERAFELPMAVLEVDMDIPTYGHVTRIHLAWSGRIDLLARINSRVRIVDHKTSSIDGDQFIQSFQLASQTIGYVWAARQLYPDFNVEGFCLNCLRLKRPTGNVGIMDRGPRGGDPALAFFRAYFDYEDERISRWYRDTILLIEDFLHSLSRGIFPMNDAQCFNKFGRCPYFDACTIDDERVGRNLLMSDNYRQVTWNPTT